jgi:uncharacterized lipoprotein YddW (UPF0748 family)
MPKTGIVITLAVILSAATQSPGGFAPIVDLPGGNSWRAGPGAPEAISADNGVKLPCAFSAQTSRVYWDHPVTANLSAATTIELELSCPDSEAVQSVGLYLKSGDGWYLWIRPLIKSGRQKFFLQVEEAATEGKPAGWHKITGARVSFQNSAPAGAAMVLHGLKAGASGIIIVKGTTSAPNNGERGVARQTAARISRWLEDAGVAHSVLDDDDIAGGRLRSASIIILPYNPQPSDRELGQLEKLSAKGCKLVVFYGSNPRLAELLGVRLGKYRASSTPGHWAGFIFNRSAPEGMPGKIIQESGNIYTVFPESENARVIAFWQDTSGRTLADPAWVLSDKGAWMTHILMGEDSEKKKKMLVALLAHFEPGVRYEARQFLKSYDNKSYGVSAPSQNINKNEFRAVWDHSGMGLYPGDWEKTCRLLARYGVTAVFPNMLWAGASHFPSKYTAWIEKSRSYGDQAEQCVRAASSAGLEIHFWKVCWNLDMAPGTFKESVRSQGRLQKNSRNETRNWLCPSDPANAALELNTILEALGRYDIDGIHLDYIRYPDGDSCYCAGCRARFEQWSGQTVAKWPGDVVSGKQKTGYRTWRKAQITNFVKTVRREMKKIKPATKLSAAVYPKYPECAESIGQDWGVWLKEGTVDFVCPMDYFPSVSSFREALERQLALPYGNKRIYPGIGATLNEGDLGQEVFTGQLRTLRERGAGGFILFDLNPSLAENFLPLLGR